MNTPVFSNVCCRVSPPSAGPGKLLRVRTPLENGNVEHGLLRIDTRDLDNSANKRDPKNHDELHIELDRIYL